MNKVLTVTVALLAALTIGLVVGCQQDNPVSPNPGGGNTPASLEVRVQSDVLKGFRGEQRTMLVTAVVRNSQNVVVPGVKVTFAIQGSETWRGTIAYASQADTTDLNGQVQAVYSVVMTQSGRVTIEARTGSVVGTKSIDLSLVQVGGVRLEALAVLSVPPNTTRQTTVTAAVFDQQGIGISGVLVHFRTTPPSLGTVDSDTGTTDFNGRVTKTFTTVANRYGLCQIEASVGDSIDTHVIEIVPVSEPQFINLQIDNPTVNVVPNQNATIPVMAVVTDRNRVGVPRAKVNFTIEPFIPGDPTFGAIALRDTVDVTNSVGQIFADFSTLGGDGRLYVVATVLPTSGSGSDTPIQDRKLITVTRLLADVGSMTMIAQPSFLHLAPDSTGTSLVKALVRGSDGRGLINVPVQFTTDYGTLSYPTPTDSSGVATVVYSITPQIDFPDPQAAELTATVRADLPGTNRTATVSIRTQKFSSEVGTLVLTTDKNEVYADNGVTAANLLVELKDADRVPMTDKEIIFSVFGEGKVDSARVRTGPDGIARNAFRGLLRPSPEGVPTRVIAKYTPMGLEAFVDITVKERNPIATISLQAGAIQMTAGRGDSTIVVATCVQENGLRAPDGTLVNFTTNLGRFTADQVYVSGGQGRAETYYVAGALAGVAQLVAYVTNPDSSVATSNVVSIVLRPGPPSQIQVRANPTELVTNDPSQYSEITAMVSDTVGNAVDPGTRVTFTTTLGTITNSALTDSSGRAIARLTTGVESGFADIVAEVQGPSGPIQGRTTVRFIAGQPNSIELSATPLQIQVAGTGGIESATLTATVRDANGNLVSAPVPIIFELIRQPAPPRGCNINQHGQVDSAYTSNGIARVTLNSGTQSGGVLIRAYSWRDPDTRTTMIQVINSQVQVVAGPPELLDIDLNEEGTDAGGGAWTVMVSARVYDLYRNPVANNIPVTFTVEPDIATIHPGHTGNGDTPVQGLAYAPMQYNSNNTLDTLTITAYVETQDGRRQGERTVALPLQEGQLQLNISPVNWMFDRARPNDLCNIRVWVVLQDGHQVLVNNGPVLFTTTRAWFYWRDYRGQYREYAPPEPAIKYTGWRPPKHPNDNEEDGVATVYLRGIMDQFFLDPYTLEVTVQIDASVVGYDDVAADPGFVFMTRH